MKTKTTTESTTNFDFSSANLPETLYNKPESETIEFVKPLKHPTQQKRVELIETQKWELISATATIDNQAATIKDLETRNDNLRSQVVTANERIEYLEHENKNYESAIAVLEGQNKKLNDVCEGFEKQAVDMTRNFESAMLQLKDCESRNNTLCDHIEAAKESRDRLASKFTNWFIFLVTISVGSIALNVYQYFK